MCSTKPMQNKTEHFLECGRTLPPESIMEWASAVSRTMQTAVGDKGRPLELCDSCGCNLMPSSVPQNILVFKSMPLMQKRADRWKSEKTGTRISSKGSLCLTRHWFYKQLRTLSPLSTLVWLALLDSQRLIHPVSKPDINKWYLKNAPLKGSI